MLIYLCGTTLKYNDPHRQPTPTSPTTNLPLYIKKGTMLSKTQAHQQLPVIHLGVAHPESFPLVKDFLYTNNTSEIVVPSASSSSNVTSSTHLTHVYSLPIAPNTASPSKSSTSNPNLISPTSTSDATTITLNPTPYTTSTSATPTITQSAYATKWPKYTHPPKYTHRPIMWHRRLLRWKRRRAQRPLVVLVVLVVLVERWWEWEKDEWEKALEGRVPAATDWGGFVALEDRLKVEVYANGSKNARVNRRRSRGRNRPSQDVLNMQTKLLDVIRKSVVEAATNPLVLKLSLKLTSPFLSVLATSPSSSTPLIKPNPTNRPNHQPHNTHPRPTPRLQSPRLALALEPEEKENAKEKQEKERAELE
ncbi:uncharacterized protein STEHIDRAFT_161514 [Stereum hirsutum FP-91666 SS1]|uniref:uncharacterized protein n=1 Tax=Stereum hirsutum (strain FP-91666) TaxID=721885 RepID=UPI000444A583|nr:uncharacterized protein STEHIDRAFT_161514 [Stereum hirsutum FP-91666 SS1]EIM82169.1 hypothetical protein STEHIDRAFT_161514 [Stereum hirsutum FP-91666 SS1]